MKARSRKKLQGELLIMSFSVVGTKTLLSARGACEYTGSQGAYNNEQHNKAYSAEHMSNNNRDDCLEL